MPHPTLVKILTEQHEFRAQIVEALKQQKRENALRRETKT